MDSFKCEGQLNKLGAKIAEWARSKGFDPAGWGNVAEKMILLTTEVGEAFQEYRKIKVLPGEGEVSEEDMDTMDKFREEIADIAIRLLSTASEMDIDLETEIDRKMKINMGRPYKHGRRC